MIYLDNHSATPPCKSAIQRMAPYLEEHWGATFSPHKMGASSILDLNGRDQILYDLAGADEKDQFVFSSSGAEAVNQIFWSIFTEVIRKTGKCHIIISEMEDMPTMMSARRLEELGCTVKIAPVVEGVIDIDALAGLISPRTAFISATMANGLTGVIQPVEELISIAREKKILLHLDAAYSLGKYPFCFESDYLSFSGDLIHSVKGSGGIFAKQNAPLSPLILGKGGMDVPSFMALSAAAGQSALYLDLMGVEIARLKDLFETLVEGEVLYQNALRLPNTSAIRFKKVHQEALLYLLNRKGVYANIGGGYSQHLSRIDETAISFSLSRMNTEEEIRRAAQIINETVCHLQTISEAL